MDDSISGTKFNFKDGTLWKKMDENILSELQELNWVSTFPVVNLGKSIHDLKTTCQNKERESALCAEYGKKKNGNLLTYRSLHLKHI